MTKVSVLSQCLCS